MIFFVPNVSPHALGLGYLQLGTVGKMIDMCSWRALWVEVCSTFEARAYDTMWNSILFSATRAMCLNFSTSQLSKRSMAFRAWSKVSCQSIQTTMLSSAPCWVREPDACWPSCSKMDDPHYPLEVNNYRVDHIIIWVYFTNTTGICGGDESAVRPIHKLSLRHLTS